jgi:5-bromo-4-chloroindolyl phosphate hydrolysis protein
MLSLEDSVKNMNLTDKIINKLLDNNIVFIKDLWVLKRKDLKKIKMTDKEIKSIIIALQLEGLDLGKKMYD